MDKLKETKINTIFEAFDYLINRWLDEMQYENFDEYRTYIKKVLANNGFKYIYLSRDLKLEFKDKQESHVLRLTKDQKHINHLVKKI